MNGCWARCSWQQRVIFGDTDQMGVVYYGNFMRYFEASRAELLRQLGRSGRDLTAWDVGLPVVEAHCRYHLSAHYEDLLEVEVWVSELRAASLRFEYRVMRESSLLAEGMTRHAVCTLAGRPQRMPSAMRELIEAAPSP